VVGAVSAFLAVPLHVGSIELSLAGLLRFIITLWFAVLAARAIRAVLESEILPRIRLPPGVPNTLVTAVHYVALLVGFVLALGAAGVDLGRITLVAGALSVGVGFGLQNIVNNFVSGLILLFERPIKVGDSIEIGTLVGTVRRIGIRACTIATFDGAEVIVPNGDLLSDRVVNWTHSDDRRRIDINVGVAYGTDPQTVIELLRRTAGHHSEVLERPAPEALFTGFGDSSLNFALRCWVASFDVAVQVRSAIAVGINAALREAGIEIPFPQRDVHVRTAPATSVPSSSQTNGDNETK